MGALYWHHERGHFGSTIIYFTIGKLTGLVRQNGTCIQRNSPSHRDWEFDHESNMRHEKTDMERTDTWIFPLRVHPFQSKSKHGFSKCSPFSCRIAPVIPSNGVDNISKLSVSKHHTRIRTPRTTKVHSRRSLACHFAVHERVAGVLTHAQSLLRRQGATGWRNHSQLTILQKRKSNGTIQNPRSAGRRAHGWWSLDTLYNDLPSPKMKSTDPTMSESLK